MTKPELLKAAAEAPKLLYENPSWSYEKIINKVKEVIQSESMAKVEKTN